MYLGFFSLRDLNATFTRAGGNAAHVEGGVLAEGGGE
jgi:hypothetical protein